MKKNEQHSLDCHQSWLRWGQKFGFKLHGSNDEWLGHFILPTREEFIVPKAARDAIDEYMRGNK